MVDDEVELVQGCLAGEHASVRAFVERFQGLIFGLCYRMLRHREDAEDVSQDVFARAFRSLRQWDQERPLKPWLMTIAANRCRTALEKRGRIPAQCEIAVDLAVDNRYKEQSDLAEELQLAIDRLREEYRACFVMFYQQEMACAQIGEILGCPEGTVKTWLHRARRELAEHLQRRGVVFGADNEMHRL